MSTSKDSQKYKGTVRFQHLGPGVWILELSQGQNFELIDPPEQIKIDGASATLWLQERRDHMSIYMIGTPAQVVGFNLD